MDEEDDNLASQHFVIGANNGAINFDNPHEADETETTARQSATTGNTMEDSQSSIGPVPHSTRSIGSLDIDKEKKAESARISFFSSSASRLPSSSRMSSTRSSTLRSSALTPQQEKMMAGYGVDTRAESAGKGNGNSYQSNAQDAQPGAFPGLPGMVSCPQGKPSEPRSAAFSDLSAHDNLENQAAMPDDLTRSISNSYKGYWVDQVDGNEATREVAPFPQAAPGAYYGGSQTTRNDRSSHFLTTSTTQPIGNLAVASVVEGTEEGGDLPQAVERDVEADRTRERKRRQCNCTLILAGMVVGIVIVLLAVFVPKEVQEINSVPEPTMFPSVSPTSAPTSLEGYVISLLPEYTLDAMEDPLSPQARAFEWLLEDTIHNQLNPFLTDQRILQRFVLATLYYATNGDEWRRNDLWLFHNISECHWFTKPDFGAKNFLSRLLDGIWAEFYPPSEPQPTACDPDTGLYQHLWLDLNKLSSKEPLPEELYLLTSLVTMSFGFSNLQGPISTRIGQLTDLEGFAINMLNNGGAIPSQFGLLTKLRGLGLHDNEHTGTIPTELALLTNLQSLSLGLSANLTGPIADLRLYPRMRWYSLEHCSLTGTIPTQIGLMTELEWFALSRNKNISGTIPTQIGSLQNISMVSLFDTHLSGTLPTQLGSMTSSTLITLRGNDLSGTIPSEFGQLTKLSHALRLQNNPLLSGTIPTELGLLENVYALEVANNQLTGPIPSELGMMSSLGRLSLGGNSLSGTIPEALEALQQSLFLLTIENNPLLSGTIPQPLCNLNGTCAEHNLRLSCPETNRMSFDCTSMLVGCSCFSFLPQN